MHGIPTLDPAIELLSRELQQNNVPPGQEGQYFQSKGSPLDPRILFMIQKNKYLHKAAGNQAQPPVSTVDDDQTNAIVQQANQAVAPQQPMGMAALQQGAPQQAPQAPPQQQGQGIAALPAGPVGQGGFARGGIVAFAGDEEENDPVTGQLVSEDEATAKDDAEDISDLGSDAAAMGGDDSGYAAAQKEAPPLLGAVANEASPQAGITNTSASSATPLAEMVKKAMNPTSAGIADRIAALKEQYAPVKALDAEEMARRAKYGEGLDAQRKKDVWNAIAQAGFGSVGKHTDLLRTIGDIGQHTTAALPQIAAAHRAATEQLKEAQYNMKRAGVLTEAGFPAQAAALQQAADKQASEARYKLSRAETAARNANTNEAYKMGLLKQDADKVRGSGTAGAQFHRNNIQPLLDQLSVAKTPEETKAIEAKLEQQLTVAKSHPELYSPSVATQQLRGENAKEIQVLKGGQGLQLQEARNAGSKVIADIRAGAAANVAQVRAAVTSLHIASDNLRGKLNGEFDPERRAAIEAEMDRTNSQLYEIYRSATGKIVAAEESKSTATPAGLPPGSKQIGTSGGKPVYQTPDGKQFIGG